MSIKFSTFVNAADYLCCESELTEWLDKLGPIYTGWRTCRLRND